MGNTASLYKYPKAFTAPEKETFNLNISRPCSRNETLIKENLAKYVTAVLNELHYQNETVEVDLKRRLWLTKTLYNTGYEILYTNSGNGFSQDDLETTLDTPGTLFGVPCDKTEHWYTYTGNDVKLYNPAGASKFFDMKKLTPKKKPAKKTAAVTKKADPVKKADPAVDTTKTTVDTKPVTTKPIRAKPVLGKQYNNAVVTVEYTEHYTGTGVLVSPWNGVGYDVTLTRVPCCGYDAWVISSINKRQSITRRPLI